MALWIAYLNCLTNQLLVDFAHSAGPLLPVNNMSSKKKERNKKVTRASLWQLLIWRCSLRGFLKIKNKEATTTKKLYPYQLAACFPSLFYTCAFARTCLTRSGRITVGCAYLSACVSYKHTFVCTSVSVVSLHLRCDLSFGWRALRARSDQVAAFMCLHTMTWTHLTQSLTCRPCVEWIQSKNMRQKPAW